MSERVYTLRVSENWVIMSFDDFTALAGELTRYGVDVRIQPGSLPEQISFTLKESPSEQ